MRGDSWKWKPDKFRQESKHIFKSEGDNHWVALPKEVMDSPTTDGFRSRLDTFLEDKP